MKITFGKNESHDYLRVRYVLHYAESSPVASAPKYMRVVWEWTCILITLIYLIMIRREIREDLLVFVLILVLRLPIHEFCHALFLWLTGRRVYAIRFYPFRSEPNKQAAYVMPELYPYTRMTYGLLVAFPLILLTVLPLLIAVFCPSLRRFLIWLALWNLSTSGFDACDLVRTVKAPTGSYNIVGYWCVPEEGETIILKRLRVKLGATSMADIEQTDFRMEGKRFVKIPTTDDDLLHSMLDGLKEEYHLTDEKGETT